MVWRGEWNSGLSMASKSTYNRVCRHYYDIVIKPDNGKLAKFVDTGTALVRGVGGV